MTHKPAIVALTLIGSALILAGSVGLGFAWMKRLPPPVDAASSVPASEAPMPTLQAAPPGAPPNTPATGAPPEPGSGPHPSWHGTWQGETPASRLVIGAEGVDLTVVREDEGRQQSHTEQCKWTPPSAQSMEGCRSGYANSSKALAAIQAEYESSVQDFQRGSVDFSISDPAPSRAALNSIRPGNYRILWTEGEGDCSRHEMIIDNDTVVSVMKCHYGHHVERFTRVR